MVHCAGWGDGVVRRILFTFIAVPILIYVGWLAFQPASHDQTAIIGGYLSEDGQLFVFSQAGKNCLRFVSEDGEAARLCRNRADEYIGATYLDGQGPENVRATFSSSSVSLSWDSGRTLSGARSAIEMTDAVFASGGVELFGQLLAPKTESDLNLAVIVQGSSRRSAVLRLREQHFLAARGVAAFVYDKRGTGRSLGDYTQDFDLLASDAAAALQTAQALLGDRGAASGFVGLSQGGWVAPLAAQGADADFVVIGYGLAVSPAEEERAQITESIAAAGFDDAAVSLAGDLADETVALAGADFASSTERYEGIKRAASSQGILDSLPDDSITGQIAAYPVGAVRWLWRFYDVDTSWFHDAGSIIEDLKIPQLWLIGLRDQEAPPGRTLEVLRAAQQTNPSLHVATFKTAGHGMIERPEGRDHPRERYAERYIPTLVEFVKSQ